MKYMGSKRTMLCNGLGRLLLEEAQSAMRFVDLFTGSGSVAWFIAEGTQLPVLAIDLQKYSTVLAESVICRDQELDTILIEDHWLKLVEQHQMEIPLWIKAKDLRVGVGIDGIKSFVEKARELCELQSSIGPIWNAYGGYYFSPSQAMTFDLLLDTLPVNYLERVVCLASCISAAIQCAAAPGHTAQPFQPTSSAGLYILESWSRDPLVYVKKALLNISKKHANTIGEVVTGDAQNSIDQIRSTDLVFIDPPYSGVQYSRFYHVLETIAERRKSLIVEGKGRYPPITERPQSGFSNKGQAKFVLERLFQSLATKGCTSVFTFPSGESSNGLSGDYIKQVASTMFRVEEHNKIAGTFSTLGGNNNNRTARQKSDELILILRPA